MLCSAYLMHAAATCKADRRCVVAVHAMSICVSTIGVTAGASAPEILVGEVIAAARKRFNVTVEEIPVTTETVKFSLPRVLND